MTIRTIASLPLCGVLVVQACAAKPAEPGCEGDSCDEAGEQVTYLDQGTEWESLRQRFYYTSQGSRLIPYSWFVHLERADSDEPFRGAANMRRLGFYVDGSATVAEHDGKPLNPDHLPIGFVRDPRAGRYGEEWMGLTCAACHTGEMTFRGRRFRIDGGAGFGDLQTMEGEILAAVDAALTDPAKQDRFVDAVLGDAAAADRTKLLEDVADYAEAMRQRIERGTARLPDGSILAYGYGRTDAFTILGNEIMCAMMPLAQNCKPATTPTNYPRLWGIGDLEWVQSNAQSHGVLSRNLGEVLGVYAHSSISCAADDPTKCTFESSADLRNLARLEDWIKRIDSPSWPAQLPPIDSDAAARGKDLYAEDCASCHPVPDEAGRYPMTAPNQCGRMFVKIGTTPVCFNKNGENLLPGVAAENCNGQDIGTDPFMAAQVVGRKASTGPLAPQFGGAAQVPGLQLLRAMLGELIRQELGRLALSPAQIQAISDYRDTIETPFAHLVSYKSRPLDGIAFSAPYLHNGSVPSLYELLLPPGQRSKTFWVGRAEFDPERVGYVSTGPGPDDDGAPLFEFDTSRPGNRNTGHEYGPARLDHPRYAADPQGVAREQDRRALIEYIKTLDVTPRSQEPLTKCTPPVTP